MLILDIKLIVIYDGTRLYDKCDRTSNIKIPYELILRSRHILDKISIQYIISKYDGEGLCCWLCRTGLVDAVYSSDGDNLAYGCSTLIISKTKFKFTLIRLSNILELLDITYSQFLDLCIMSGCDYNTNIYNVGISKCYDLIIRYGCYNNIVLNYPGCDFECLRYNRCIEIFTCFSCVEGIEMPDLDFSANKDLIEYLVQSKTLPI
jgi:5'-3' exonuclease